MSTGERAASRKCAAVRAPIKKRFNCAQAPPSPLAPHLSMEDDFDGLVKHFLQPRHGQRRAFDVLDRAHLLPQLLAVLWRRGDLAELPQLCDRLGVVPQVDLGANEEDRRQRGVVSQLLEPLQEEEDEGGKGGGIWRGRRKKGAE